MLLSETVGLVRTFKWIRMHLEKGQPSAVIKAFSERGNCMFSRCAA
jgi:hypothetical protein